MRGGCRSGSLAAGGFEIHLRPSIAHHHHQRAAILCDTCHLRASSLTEQPVSTARSPLHTALPCPLHRSAVGIRCVRCVAPRSPRSAPHCPARRRNFTPTPRPWRSTFPLNNPHSTPSSIFQNTNFSPSFFVYIRHLYNRSSRPPLAHVFHCNHFPKVFAHSRAALACSSSHRFPCIFAALPHHPHPTDSPVHETLLRYHQDAWRAQPLYVRLAPNIPHSPIGPFAGPMSRM